MNSRLTSHVSRLSLICLAVLIGLVFSQGTAASDNESRPDWNPTIVTALMERYELSEAQVIERLAAQAQAIELYEPIQKELGEDYAGAWFDNEELTFSVAVADKSHFDWLGQLGVRPVLVEHSLVELGQAADLMRANVANELEWKKNVTSWSISYERNALVVRITDSSDSEPALRSLLNRRLGNNARLIEFHESLGKANLLNQIRGGDPYDPDPESGEGFPCSFGFAVDATFLPENTFITAGHCGWPSHSILNSSQQTIGHFSQSTYPPDVLVPPSHEGPGFSHPNRDYAVIYLSSGWASTAQLNTYDGEDRWIMGRTSSPIGTFVCRYGRTTHGPHCGTITDKGVTVGQIYDFRFDLYVTHENLIETSTCADLGDSGGPFVSHVGSLQSRAEGMTSVAVGGLGCPNFKSRIYFVPTGYPWQHIGTFDVKSVYLK